MIAKEEGETNLNDELDQERNAILIKRKYPSLDSLKVKRIYYIIFSLPCIIFALFLLFSSFYP